MKADNVEIEFNRRRGMESKKIVWAWLFLACGLVGSACQGVELLTSENAAAQEDEGADGAEEFCTFSHQSDTYDHTGLLVLGDDSNSVNFFKSETLALSFQVQPSEPKRLVFSLVLLPKSTSEAAPTEAYRVHVRHTTTELTSELRDDGVYTPSCISTVIDWKTRWVCTLTLWFSAQETTQQEPVATTYSVEVLTHINHQPDQEAIVYEFSAQGNCYHQQPPVSDALPAVDNSVWVMQSNAAHACSQDQLCLTTSSEVVQTTHNELGTPVSQAGAVYGVCTVQDGEITIGASQPLSAVCEPTNTCGEVGLKYGPRLLDIPSSQWADNVYRLSCAQGNVQAADYPAPTAYGYWVQLDSGNTVSIDAYQSIPLPKDTRDCNACMLYVGCIPDIEDLDNDGTIVQCEGVCTPGVDPNRSGKVRVCGGISCVPDEDSSDGEITQCTGACTPQNDPAAGIIVHCGPDTGP